MADELIRERSAAGVTRRSVVGTGVKLTYAAPALAASYKLGASSGSALSAECTPSNCGDLLTCGESSSCYCRDVNGTVICLQNRLCANPKSKVCTSSSDCTDLPGGKCVDSVSNCCDDGFSHCSYPCSTGAASVHSFGTETSGAGGVLGPVYLDD